MTGYRSHVVSVWAMLAGYLGAHFARAGGIPNTPRGQGFIDGSFTFWAILAWLIVGSITRSIQAAAPRSEG